MTLQWAGKVASSKALRISMMPSISGGRLGSDYCESLLRPPGQFLRGASDQRIRSR